MAGYISKKTPTICETMASDEVNAIYALFDLLNKDLAVKSTPPQKDQLLLVSTAGVRKIRVKLLDNIPGCTLKMCANVMFITDILTYQYY